MNGLDRGGIFRLKEELSNLRQTFVKSTSDEYRRSSGLEKLVRFEQSGSALAKLQELSKQATRNSDGYEKSMAGYDASPSSSESLRDSNASSSSETMRKQGQRDHLSYRQPFLVSQLQESRRHSDIAWEKLDKHERAMLRRRFPDASMPKKMVPDPSGVADGEDLEFIDQDELLDREAEEIVLCEKLAFL